MKKMSVTARCKLHRTWSYVKILSLGVSLSIAWASTGWFARDVLATSERRDMRLEFKQYIADQTELENKRARRQMDSYNLIMKEKDARIQELTAELTVLTTKTTRAADDADKAAKGIDKLLQHPPAIIITPAVPAIKPDAGDRK